MTADTASRTLDGIILCLASILCGAYFVPNAHASENPMDISRVEATTIPDKIKSMQILKDRLLDESFSVWRGQRDDRNASRFLASQEIDGSWADIDYADTSKYGANEWEPLLHLRRLQMLASAAQNPASGHYQSKEMLSGALRGLDFWLKRKPVCLDNYWHMAIGRNVPMGAIALILDGHLNPAQKEAVLEELHYGVQDTNGDGVREYHYNKIGVEATGQNLLWLADIHLRAALLSDSPKEVAGAAGTLASVVAITTEEGINPDYSFLQHGHQLYSGGYGHGFARDAARNLALFHGLAYAFDEEQTQALRNYFLDGWQWMIRRGSWDPLVTGREIGRRNKIRLDASMTAAIRNMQKGDPAFAEAYQAMLDHIEGRNDASLVGNKHFYRADYTAHRRPHYSIHTRMTSERTLVAETGNNENIQNSYLSQGNYVVMVDGDEYMNIFPLWRWDRIPGGTAPAKDPAPRTANWFASGTQSFVGGVSNGTYGVSAKDLNWDGVTARKSWFYFDDDIVCLGAGITANAEFKVNTTLNQAALSSDVLVGYGESEGEPAQQGASVMLENPSWVYQGNVGYVLPFPAKLELRNEKGVRGDWHAVSPGRFPKGTMETKDIFMLGIPHGEKPSDAEYAYILLPGQPVEFVRSYAVSPQSRIIANTPCLQAVRNDVKQVAGVVFWEAGSVTLSPGFSMAASGPCIVLIDQSTDTPTLSASSHIAGPLDLHINHPTAGRRTLRFDLPAKPMLGASVTQPLR